MSCNADYVVKEGNVEKTDLACGGLKKKKNALEMLHGNVPEVSPLT